VRRGSQGCGDRKTIELANHHHRPIAYITTYCCVSTSVFGTLTISLSVTSMTSPEKVNLKVKSSDAVVFLNDDDIIEVIPDRETEMTVENLLDGMTAVEKIAQGKKHCILMIVHARNSMSKEARELDINERKSKYTIAQAIVVGSMSTLIAANFYVRFKTFPFPYKVFKSRDKAMVWLRRKRLEAGEV
jgi:hypothetical protein